MKFIKKVLKLVFVFFNWVMDNIKDIIQLVILVVAIAALIYSQLNFRENIRTSKESSIALLKNAKQLNDSIIEAIKELQDVSRSQKALIDEQLKISKETLQEFQYAARAKTIISNYRFRSYDSISNNMWFPIFEFNITNQGKTIAKKVTYASFFLDSTFEIMANNPINFLVSNSLEYEIFEIEPNGKIPITLSTKLKLESRNGFYFCIIYQYYDLMLKENLKLFKMVEYSPKDNDQNIIYCSQKEERLIRQKISAYLNRSVTEVFFEISK